MDAVNKDLCELVQHVPENAKQRDWTLRDDNHHHHHGKIEMDESPLYLVLTWKETSNSQEKPVGIFRLYLKGLLDAGYIRLDDPEESTTLLRVNVLLDGGVFCLATRKDRPALRMLD